jgi:hypothetical protein
MADVLHRSYLSCLTPCLDAIHAMAHTIERIREHAVQVPRYPSSVGDDFPAGSRRRTRRIGEGRWPDAILRRSFSACALLFRRSERPEARKLSLVVNTGDRALRQLPDDARGLCRPRGGGLTTIDIAVEGGGCTLIRVSDDGHGMARNEILLALDAIDRLDSSTPTNARSCSRPTRWAQAAAPSE